MVSAMSRDIRPGCPELGHYPRHQETPAQRPFLAQQEGPLALSMYRHRRGAGRAEPHRLGIEYVGDDCGGATFDIDGGQRLV